MRQQKSILFFCRNFHRMAGGVERMATLIMNQMVERGYRVGLVTWDPVDAQPHYPLNASIKWIKLNLGAAEFSAGWVLRLRRQIAIRRAASKFRPDVAIGFQVGTFLAARISMLGMGIPMIAAERNSPDLFDFVINGKRQRWKANFALMMADCVTVQFDSYKEKYPSQIRKHIVTIPNPVQTLAQPAYPNEADIKPRRILNVGRLSYQKNQLFLIRAFSRIARLYPDWVLTIVGEGEKRSKLEKLIADSGLNDRVELIGAVKDVDSWYCKSSFLAFPSLWEGFPNALVEGFRQGLPAIGLIQTAGVNELIVHNETGILASNNEASFALAMQALIDDFEFRCRAGRAARNSVLGFEPEVIFNEWDNLFSRLVERH